MEKKQKLRSNSDFRKVYDKGKSLANRYLVIFFIKNSLNYNRVGFSTTKKLGKNIIRNRIKRRMKEAHRLNTKKIKQGYDIIFLARLSAKDVDYKAIDSAVLHLLKISGLLEKGE